MYTRKVAVQSEALSAPVTRGSQASQLPADKAAILLLPLPHLLCEGLPAHLLPASALPFQHLLHHHLAVGITASQHAVLRQVRRSCMYHCLPL